MFDQTFVDSLPSDNDRALQLICQKILKYAQRAGMIDVERADFFRRALAFVKAFCESRGLEDPFSLPDSSDPTKQIKILSAQFKNVLEQASLRVNRDELSESRAEYSMLFDSLFYYEFSDSELSRIQTLLNELREAISTTSELEDQHRSRLLKRLEKLQSELHKKVPDVDRYWAFVGDAGAALRKLGNDAEPLVKRIHEIVKIIWGVQADALRLPRSMPMRLLDADSPDSEESDAGSSDD
ncbi:MAG: hypothetical protein MI923_00120 [Phycisphaerales bacterium]|nr:hypothetical protein [Phycisphaerales bacterium]